MEQKVTDRMLRRKAVLEMLGISSATLHRRIKDGSIQPPLRLGPSAVGWRESYILSVMDSYETATPIEVAPGAKRGRKKKEYANGAVIKREEGEV